MIVEYAKDGDVVSDFEVNQYVEHAITNNIERCTVSSSIVVDTFRLFYVQNKIDNLVFEFNGEILSLDKGGRLDKWPEGFCAVFEDQITQLIWPDGIYNNEK